MKLSRREKVVGTLITVALLLVIGTLAYSYLEGWSLIESLYFSVATLTTVGYGDLYPTTDMSRLFTTGYLIIGVTVMLASLGEIGAYYMERRDNQISSFKGRDDSDKEVQE